MEGDRKRGRLIEGDKERREADSQREIEREGRRQTHRGR